MTNLISMSLQRWSWYLKSADCGFSNVIKECVYNAVTGKFSEILHFDYLRLFCNMILKILSILRMYSQIKIQCIHNLLVFYYFYLIRRIRSWTGFSYMQASYLYSSQLNASFRLEFLSCMSPIYCREHKLIESCRDWGQKQTWFWSVKNCMIDRTFKLVMLANSFNPGDCPLGDICSLLDW